VVVVVVVVVVVRARPGIIITRSLFCWLLLLLLLLSSRRRHRACVALRCVASVRRVACHERRYFTYRAAEELLECVGKQELVQGPVAARRCVLRAALDAVVAMEVRTRLGVSISSR
jgi:hypothetical protein